MRIAVATESFLPSLNGVTTSVCRVTEELTAAGHETLILAPGPGPARHAGARVASLPGVPVRGFRAGVPTAQVHRALADFAPDVVHLASPFLVGAAAARQAGKLGVPTVAIYQTDMPAYVRQHGRGRVAHQAGEATWRWIRRLHDQVDRTLAPSRPTLTELRERGIPRTALWGRGVDTHLFHPRWRDDEGTAALRSTLAPGGEVLLGYVGRLAPEKELERLAALAHIPGTRLVIVGEGPSRWPLGARLSEAVASRRGRPNLPPVFLGARSGDNLARAYAALDVFVHTGTKETFGQTLQEAAASGLPVVAPARGGPLDLVTPGVTGDLFDPDDPTSIAAAVAPFVEDAGRRARAGAAGREMVSGRSWASLTTQLVEHYQAVA